LCVCVCLCVCVSVCLCVWVWTDTEGPTAYFPSVVAWVTPQQEEEEEEEVRARGLLPGDAGVNYIFLCKVILSYVLLHKTYCQEMLQAKIRKSLSCDANLLITVS